jgi:hypothetical protein
MVRPWALAHSRPAFGLWLAYDVSTGDPDRTSHQPADFVDPTAEPPRNGVALMDGLCRAGSLSGASFHNGELCMTRVSLSTLIASAGLAAAAHAQTTFPETEGNDSKSLANGPFTLASGDMLTGNSTSSSSAGLDYFLVKTATAPLAIYRHRLAITTSGTAGHTGTIRGLTQTAGAINSGTDAAVQTSVSGSTPPRFVQWYGFGKNEQIYYRVTGTGSTLSDYTATLETTPVTVVDAGTYFGGSITIERAAGVTTDTDLWVYDGALTAMPDYGNDTPNSLTRTFAPGTYYVAFSNANVANDQPAATGDTNLTANVLDFPDAVANSSTTTSAALAIRLSDSYGPLDTPAPKTEAFQVVWVRFTVSAAAPASGACCMPDGTCVTRRGASCSLLGGAYQGDGSSCSLVACPQPGACCMPDYTCSILSSGQCATASGTYQGNGTACAACPAPAPGTVAILAATTADDIADVQSRLTGTGLFPQVVVVSNVQTATPSLAYLQQFSALLTWSNQNYASGAALGDVLADYVDAGGGVVTAIFTNTSTTANRFLAGRWDTTYQIIPNGGGTTSGARTLGTIVIPGHPLMNGVSTLATSSTSFSPTQTTLTPHGLLVAQWDNNKVLAAVSSTRPRRVDIGLYPPSTTSNSTGWVPTSDGARFMANALLYAGRPLNTCYANCDASTAAPVLNVADFTCFLQKFAAGDAYANCDSSTAAPVLNVADFTCFLQKFAAGCQ